MRNGPARCVLFDDQFSLESPTGALLNVYRAQPRSRPRGILLLQHGLAEHARRYARTAGELADAGIAVYAHDHRGHGSTAAFDAPLRHFAKRNGPKKLVADCHAVRARATADHSGLPVVVLGHSMGGLVAMNYAIRHPEGLAGLALWNAGFRYGAQERLAVAALRIERMLKGSDVASAVFDRATTDLWSTSVTPRRTAADWLSHDASQVDAYLEDPLCGWSPTISMAIDLIDLVEGAADGARGSKLPPSLPLHILGGTGDPSTAEGRAVKSLADRLRLAGSRDLTLEMVDGARHETLNEMEPYRGRAMHGLFAWLDRILPVH